MRVERMRGLAVARGARRVHCIDACRAFAAACEVIALPDGAASATYEDRPVLIVEAAETHRDRRHRARRQRSADTCWSSSRPSGVRTEIPFKVTDKAYPVQRLTLADDKMVNPPPDELARIERETILQNAQYDRFTPLAASPFPMQLPAAGRGQFELRTAPHPERTTPQPARRPRHRGAAPAHP